MSKLLKGYLEDAEREARGRLFADLWPVAPDYQIAEGHVVAAGSVKGGRTYHPMGLLGLPVALAQAASGRERDVLEFVGRYGLLGYQQAVLYEPLITARHLEGDHSEHAAPLLGDPLAWFIAHAKTVKLILDLIGSLPKDVDVRTAIDLLRVRDGSRDTIEYTFACRGHLRPMRQRLARVLVSADGSYVATTKAAPRTVARHIIASVVNANITGVSRHVMVEWQPYDGDAEGFSSQFSSHSLLDVIYWQLADAAIGGLVRRCAYPLCGAFFIANSLKVTHCPPPAGDFGVSPCMNRHKQRKWRMSRQPSTTPTTAKKTTTKKGTRR